MKKETIEEKGTIIPIKYIIAIIAFLLILISKTLSDYKEAARLCETKYSDLLKEEVKDLQQDLIKKPEVIYDTIYDTVYYAKGILGKYKQIEKSLLFKSEENNLDTLK